MTKRQNNQPEAPQTSANRTLNLARKTHGEFAIIAVGASSGGLESFTEFLKAFPAQTGMAIIFIQHLEPTHKSMMVDLLGPHTSMPIQEAADGVQIQPDHIYVIAPGTRLAIDNGALIVTHPKERHGAQMPFDFLLRSLAESLGERGIGVVLSGNGTDGSLGLQAIKDRGGLVIAQHPDEALHSGMPQSAINKGVVDLILPIGKMAPSLVGYAEQIKLLDERENAAEEEADAAELRQIIDLLHARAEQDFSGYKPGTIMRRIARRMAIHGINKVAGYLSLLRDDGQEIDKLAQDLLIHVTSFFRDAHVFELLAAKIIPEIVQNALAEQTIRVWVPACSTGEEVYSLAILFLENIATTQKSIKLQMFGSDIDERAVAIARAGLYPLTIKNHISAERLERFFTEVADGYRIAAILRESAIFTVQDVLTDPPFAQLNFVSCRNLLIYLLPDSQQRVLTMLHFALRNNGLLLLGIAENVGVLRGDFETVSEELRIFRRVGSSRKLRPQYGFNNQPRAFWPRSIQTSAQRGVNIGEFSQRLLLETYVPASVLINHKDEGLYYFGPTDKYLQIPSGDASHGIFAVVRQGLRNKARTAVHRARQEQTLVIVSGGSVVRNDISTEVRIEARPVKSDGNEFVLVSFVDEPLRPANDQNMLTATDESSTKTADFERVLEALQKELRETTLELENSSADHEAINEEAQSLNEEYQSTNEELETSKEELQSLNEELTALNSQLSATVNQQRTTADDIDNILRSSELAIVFLDVDLSIRFFSPAAKTLLNAIDSDIGRPINDLAHRFDDEDLLADIRSVLKTLTPQSREVRSHNGDWYTRRILPYRAMAGGTQGVIITFNNISVIKAAELRIEAARAYTDNITDSIRQPLVVLDERLNIVSSNYSFRQAFGKQHEEFIGQSFRKIGGGQLDVPSINIFLDRARAETAPINDYEVEVEFSNTGKHILLLSSRKVLSDYAGKHNLLIAADDITERKAISDALEVAKMKAEQANLGKSRFLAAASHDLRQPLQTLSLLHGILARKLTEPETLAMIGKLDETLGAMSGMLDTLLDINQLEAGTVQPEIDSFSVMAILENLKSEFTYLTKSKNLSLHVVANSLRVRSDPLLLSQMIRNLLSNAVKYTKSGKILMGCRQVKNKVRIEVWDTGIGIPSGQLKAIFEEYHQLGNPARERGLGLGLGLSIVHRIGELLGHSVNVRSVAGKGSVFIIEVPLGDKPEKSSKAPSPARKIEKTSISNGTVLIVEDDPTVREALELLLSSEGYRTITAVDGIEVAALAERGALMPDLILADYNLPGGRTGLEVITELRRKLARNIPAIILTGDIATDVLRKVVSGGCGYLHKPVNVDQLTQRIAELVVSSKQSTARPKSAKATVAPETETSFTVYIVDDDTSLLDSMSTMLQQHGYRTASYPSADAFLSAYQATHRGCLIVDSVMPGMHGLDLMKKLKAEGSSLPSIMITGFGDIAMAIQAMKAGAIDFIEKPARQPELIAAIEHALMQAGDKAGHLSNKEAAAASIAALTPREREVMALVVEGLPNKQIAFKLKISQRTVETHRAAVMKRTKTDSLPDLIRLVMRAG